MPWSRFDLRHATVMTEYARKNALAEWLRTFLGSARFASALSIATVGMAFCSHLLRSTMGWPGLIGMLCALVVLAAFSFVAHRDIIEWQGLLPISIILFVGWCGLSVFWSNYQWVALGSVFYQFAFAFLGIYIALVRDAIQVVRVVGDVLRALLVVSLGLEVISGLLIDLPIRFLGIEGNIGDGGPIQGLFDTRNRLAFVSLIALVTFLVEWRTRSVRRSIAIFSTALAGVSLVLTQSPTAVPVLVAVGVSAIALAGLRKIHADRRKFWQFGLLALAVIAIVSTYLVRVRIIDFLNAKTEFQTRYTLWIQVWDLIPVNQLNGWGWVGTWHTNLIPYSWIDLATSTNHHNALNGFLDVYLQLGLIGLLVFVALVALALGRSWLLASNKHSVIYVWSPLVLVVLLTTSAFESTILVDAGWLLLVVCAVKASQGMSWRSALRGPATR